MYRQSIFHSVSRFLARTLSYALFLVPGFRSVLSRGYLVPRVDSRRHLIYGDTYIQKEYQKNKYICKYIYVYIDVEITFVYSFPVTKRTRRYASVNPRLIFIDSFSDD